MTDPSGANAGGAGSLHRIPPLQGADNYNVWRIQMEDVLTDLDLYGHADGSKLKPNSKVEVAITGRKDDEGNRLPDLEVDSDNPLYASWIKADRKALSNIRLRVDGSVLTHIQGCTTAADAWSTLEATFQVKGTVGLIDLRRRFFSHRMTDGEDIEEHIQRMRGWYQQINSISKDSCTEVDWITTLIASLPDSWDTFTQSVNFQFDLDDKNKQANQISDLRSRILAEAHRRNTRGTDGKAFFSTNKSTVNRAIRTNGKGPDKTKSKCNNCGQLGHWIAECQSPGGGAFKSGNKAVEKSTSADYAFSTIEESYGTISFRVSMDRDRLVIYGPNNECITYGLKLKERAKGNLWKINARYINKQNANNKSTELALLKQTGRTWFDWHKALGHIGPQALQRLKNTDAVKGMEIADDAIGLNFECDVCAQTKAHTRPFPKESATKVSDIGFLRHKDETLNEYKSFEAILNTQKDKKIKKVRFDNGREFVNKDWIEHAARRGTILETMAPYSAQQNGIAERLNRTLTEKARAMLLESNAPKFLWSEAIAYACYLKNRVPTQVHGTFWKTPYEAFWGIKPNVNTLRPWGSKCYVLNQGGDSSKLDPKTTTAIFVGISDVQGKSWRYYKSGSNRILHSRNVTFPSHARIEEVDNGEPEPGESVAPPAEGEMTQANSAAQQPIENTRTGGAHVDSEEIKIKKLEHTGIKTEPLSNESTSNKPTQPIQQSLNQPVVPKPTTVRNNPVMRTGNNSISNSTLQTINALEGNVSTGARTRSRNPNPTHVSLQRERGGVRIKLPDNVATGQLNNQATNETTNLVLDLPDTASMHSDSSDVDLDAYTFSTDTSSILSAPTIPSELAYLLATPPATELDTSLSDSLNDRFSYLNLSESTSTESDTTLATPGDVEHEWAYAAKLSAPNDHPTVAEALAGPDAEEWQKAMAKEVSTFKKMDTYDLTDLPPGHKAIGNAWVFTLKRNADGTPARYKGRLVAQGFSQRPGIDFDETFAPVVRLDSIRLLLSIANQNDWDIRQLNVNSAYLHAKVNEELYMRQIPYFEDGRMWNKLYDTKLKSLGYSPCLTDACVYKRMVNTEGELRISIIATHVDDSIVITSRDHTESAIAKLLHEFDMRDLGNIHHFLGIAIVRNPIIAGLGNAYPADTPISPTTQLTRYKGTKPKFNYAQFTTCYGPAHVTAVNRVVRYLKGTSALGLTYRRSTNDFGEIGYSDADWGSNLLDPKKQATVALSTMEAEYMSLSHACTQALWMRQLFEELNFTTDDPTLILSDNLAALALSAESQFHGRSKHIDIRHHFMRDIIEKHSLPPELKKSPYWFLENPLALLIKHNTMIQNETRTPRIIRKSVEEIYGAYEDTTETLDEWLEWINGCPPQPTKGIQELYNRFIQVQSRLDDLIRHLEKLSTEEKE
ncbi:Retrovirus-related Pol polyprotein from transposon TNT 1-94 [Rhizoctonia solani]|uniref:Retrovirus-related Pol polyprotein from transposon TNT 1-94 n=1 Tax=Rhizoctonia solani TaxID=456999 RepID=A0A8H8P3U5_9AGAM|nr:Retrovirus-related Pol polyprotein from transposon TNT 1-94 [Rhizoctonia solani]QRW23117.1 Retrovirus-related Pol polyprotein from transposon TNT 1-94 [Rhizoctonia solani]